MEQDRQSIQDRMLAGISDQYNKSQGSFFYDALKPVAIELEQCYARQEAILDKGFVATAAGEYLDRKAAEQGLYRKEATKAITTVTITGTEGAVIREGDRVAGDTVTFVCIETKTIDASGQAYVRVECEEAGSVGNVPVGAIKYYPVKLTGLETVTNLEKAENGYDGEEDEALRQRYLDKVQTPATSGNKHHYRNWAKEVPGVGDARVFPLTNAQGNKENGTVKVVIIDADKKAASVELISEVTAKIEEVRPIGASVVVQSAVKVPINVQVTDLTVDTVNHTLEQVKKDIEKNIEQYLKDIAFHPTTNYVSRAIIGSYILNVAGVINYGDIQLNGAAQDIIIEADQIAVMEEGVRLV